MQDEFQSGLVVDLPQCREHHRPEVPIKGHPDCLIHRINVRLTLVRGEQDRRIGISVHVEEKLLHDPPVGAVERRKGIILPASNLVEEFTAE